MGENWAPRMRHPHFFEKTKVSRRDISIKRLNHAPTRDVLILSNMSPQNRRSRSRHPRKLGISGSCGPLLFLIRLKRQRFNKFRVLTTSYYFVLLLTSSYYSLLLFITSSYFFLLPPTSSCFLLLFTTPYYFLLLLNTS